MQLTTEVEPPKKVFPSPHPRRTSLLLAANGSPDARSRIKSLINRADWLRLLTLEASPDTLVERKIDADIVVLSADQAPLTLLEALCRRYCVVGYVDHAPRSAVFGLLRAGIAGVIPAGIRGPELEAALRAVHNGLQVVHKSLTQDKEPGSIRAEHLTDREQEVLVLMAEGLANKEISARMVISENTVKFHISSVLGKLNAGSRTEAVSIGIRRGLVTI